MDGMYVCAVMLGRPEYSGARDITARESSWMTRREWREWPAQTRVWANATRCGYCWMIVPEADKECEHCGAPLI